MSVLMISFLVSIGAAVWIYYKFAKRTGSGNLGPAVIGATVCGVVIFVIFYLTLGSFID